ncbi:MAG TPA: hypothetical protein VGM39_05160, partial [Kofleriaceae bacterium]
MDLDTVEKLTDLEVGKQSLVCMWHHRHRMWDELWLGREVFSRDLIAVVSHALGVSEDDTSVIDGIATDNPSSAPVTIYRSKGGGEFPTRIQLAGTAPDDRRVFCARLASALSCKVLGDDGQINPLTFMLYEPGNATRVSVDQAHLEQNEMVVIGAYVPLPDDDSHPTKPIRRYPEPAAHRTSRGGQVAYIVNDYMVEGLPRPPLVTWSSAMTEIYTQLHRLLSTLAYRE